MALVLSHGCAGKGFTTSGRVYRSEKQDIEREIGSPASMGSIVMRADARATLEEAYRARTPRSAEAMAQARRYMVRGITRGWGYYRPYPIVGDHGEGPYLVDLDGNRYVDLVTNGLSLIHGHAFPPVVQALQQAVQRGSG